MKDFDNCQVYIGKNALRVVRAGYTSSIICLGEWCEAEGTYIPLGIALANLDKPFMTFGLPKKLKKYIEERARNVLETPKSKKGKFSVLAPGPEEGIGMWIYERKKTGALTEKNKKEWFRQGATLMTVEEAVVYGKLFDKSFFSGGGPEADSVEGEFNKMLK